MQVDQNNASIVASLNTVGLLLRSLSQMFFLFSANDPMTGEVQQKTCQQTNRSIVFGGSYATCTAMKAATQTACGGKTSTVIGGKHGSSADCALLCDKDWGAGDVRNTSSHG